MKRIYHVWMEDEGIPDPECNSVVSTYGQALDELFYWTEEEPVMEKAADDEWFWRVSDLLTGHIIREEV